MLVQFENVALEVREEPTHEWLLETALVADGYDTTKDAVLKTLQRNKDEFVEGKHFILMSNEITEAAMTANPLLPLDAQRFIVWLFTRDEWRYDSTENLWVQYGYRSRTTDELYQYFYSKG